VTSAVHEATLLSDVGSELSYQLPLSAAPVFAQLFAKLDSQVEEGGISCYGVSMTTLNEVFSQVTRGEALAANSIQSPRALSSVLSKDRASSRSIEDDPDLALSSDVNESATEMLVDSARGLQSPSALFFRRSDQ
jgi:hypothetical protein